MRIRLALVACLLASTALAQTRQPAQITTTPSATPQSFDVLDKGGAWSRLGYVDPTSHAFQAVAGGVALSSFGAVSSPTGTPADASAALTAAVNYVNGRPIPIIIDGRYGLTSWTSSVPFDLEGSNNAMRSIQSIATPPCTTGFVNLGGANATLITATGLTAAVRGLCIEMASAPGVQTGGSAILITGTSTTPITNAAVENNTIFYPWRGVDIEAVNSAQQNLSPFVRDNNVIQPMEIAFAFGLTSVAAAGGNQAIVSGNSVNCNGNYGGGANGSPTSVGFWFAATAPFVENNNPYRCNVGTKLVTVLPQQVISGSFSGWMGDSSIAHELMIGVEAASTSAQIVKTNFTHWYVGATSSTGALNQPILIYNNGSAGSVRALTFVGGILHFGGAVVTTQDFWDIKNDVHDLTIVGNEFFNDSSTSSQPPGIVLSATGVTNVNITGNTFSGQPWGPPVSITGTGDFFQIVGNNFSNSTSPIAWPTLNTASSRAVIKSNLGGNGLFEYNGPVVSLTPDANNSYALTYGDNTTGLITLTAGATPGSGGNVRLNFNRTAPHGWTCNAVLGNQFANGATVKMTPTTGSVTLFWSNVATNLTTGNTYQIFYSGCAQQ